MTGGAEINFGGHEKFLLCGFEGGTRSFFECGSNEKGEDQKKKVFSTNISTNFVCRLKILAVFHELLSLDQKKRPSSQKFYETRCESTKITKSQFLLANSRAVNPNLGVVGQDLHSSSPEPVNFFGAQSLFGEGHNFCLGGHMQSFEGHGPGMPPVAPGL